MSEPRCAHDGARKSKVVIQGKAYPLCPNCRDLWTKVELGEAPPPPADLPEAPPDNPQQVEDLREIALLRMEIQFDEEQLSAKRDQLRDLLFDFKVNWSRGYNIMSWARMAELLRMSMSGVADRAHWVSGKGTVKTPMHQPREFTPSELRAYATLRRRANRGVLTRAERRERKAKPK
jgi:hypothetical protein